MHVFLTNPELEIDNVFGGVTIDSTDSDTSLVVLAPKDKYSGALW
jgi:hypothetical protein